LEDRRLGGRQRAAVTTANAHVHRHEKVRRGASEDDVARDGLIDDALVVETVGIRLGDALRQVDRVFHRHRHAIEAHELGARTDHRCVLGIGRHLGHLLEGHARKVDYRLGRRRLLERLDRRHEAALRQRRARGALLLLHL
jgi:hypothetical protein